MNLIGKRVQHNCLDPDCPLKGVIIEKMFFPMFSKSGELYFRWVRVRFDNIANYHYTEHIHDENILYEQWLPLKKVRLI